MSIAATFKPPGLSTPRPEGKPATRVDQRHPMIPDVLYTATPIVAVATAAGGVVAVGYRDWSAGEWAMVLGVVSTVGTALIAAVITGVIQIIRAVRGEAEKTRGELAVNTAITKRTAGKADVAAHNAEKAAAHNVEDVADQIAKMRRGVEEVLASVPAQVENAVKHAIDHKLNNLKNQQALEAEARKLDGIQATADRIEDKIDHTGGNSESRQP